MGVRSSMHRRAVLPKRRTFIGRRHSRSDAPLRDVRGFRRVLSGLWPLLVGLQHLDLQDPRGPRRHRKSDQRIRTP